MVRIQVSDPDPGIAVRVIVERLQGVDLVNVPYRVPG